MALLYGVLNCILSVPSLYGYSSVIFAAAPFGAYSSRLAKLVVLSSAVHQCCFSAWSSLPFAIGQVQDAGLIFLSHIANRVAFDVSREGGTEADAVSTTLIALCSATALLGLALLVFGRARLTFAVAYLPMPVLGGYLAYIGLFCVEAGLGLCVGDVIAGPSTWPRLWQPPRRLGLALPGALGGLVLMRVSRFYAGSNNAAMPAAMLGLLGAFYVGVWVTPGASVEAARRQGWLAPLSESAGLVETLALYVSGRVHWLAACRAVASSWVAMTLVVAFSSCLDIAAIEVDLGRAVDMDAELETVGKANIVSGLCGGFTGSYIFSQTIFTCRTGTRSRLVGWCVFLCELVVVVVPLDLSASLPLYFFSATLSFVGIDLLAEWLWEARDKYASRLEYLSSLFTFGAIQVLGLDSGLLLGIVAAAGVFVYAAAQLVDDRAHQMSRVAPRTIEPRKKPAEARALERFKDQLVVLELRGQLWWGNAANMLGKIKAALRLARSDDATETTSLLARAAATRDGWHLVLDVRHVDGIDASAVRSLFLPLSQLATSGECSLGFASLAAAQERLLKRHGVMPHGRVAFFDSIDDALDWAQRRQLALVGLGPDSSGRLPPPPSSYPLLPAHLEPAPCLTNHQALSASLPVGAARRPPTAASWLEDDCLSLGAARFLANNVLKAGDRYHALAVDALRRFCKRERRAAAGDALFGPGDPATEFFVVLTGSVALSCAVRNLETNTFIHRAGRRAAPGAAFGFVDGFLDNPHPTRSLAAVAREPTSLAAFAFNDLDALFLHAPEVALALHRALLEQASTELVSP